MFYMSHQLLETIIDLLSKGDKIKLERTQFDGFLRVSVLDRRLNRKSEYDDRDFFLLPESENEFRESIISERLKQCHEANVGDHKGRGYSGDKYDTRIR